MTTVTHQGVGNPLYDNSRKPLTSSDARNTPLARLAVLRRRGLSPAGYARLLVDVLTNLAALHGEPDERSCERAAQGILSAQLVAARQANDEAAVRYLRRAQAAHGTVMLLRDLDEPVPYRIAGAC